MGLNVKGKLIDVIVMRWFLSGLLILPISYFSFKKLNEFSWTLVLFITFSYLLLFGIKTKISIWKKICFNLSAAVLALFLFEGSLCLVNWSKKSGKSLLTTGSYSSPDQYLGYGPNNDGIFESKRTYNEEVVFDVFYTIKNGLRYTPDSNEDSQNCVLFFGCSITFGEGLPDTTTLPFYFNHIADKQYKVMNYGFSGYGPHQMLSLIANRVPIDIQECNNNKIAIYTYFNGHIARAAGYSTWDQKGPRYEIINGNLLNVGTFTKLPGNISSVLMKSYTYKRLFIERKTSHYDLLRVVEIVKKSKELLDQMGVSFYVFVYNGLDINNMDKNNDEKYFLKEMEESNIRTFLLSDAIPDYYERQDTYVINKNDLHPNGLANRKIARYLSLQLKNY